MKSYTGKWLIVDSMYMHTCSFIFLFCIHSVSSCNGIQKAYRHDVAKWNSFMHWHSALSKLPTWSGWGEVTWWCCKQLQWELPFIGTLEYSLYPEMVCSLIYFQSLSFLCTRLYRDLCIDLVVKDQHNFVIGNSEEWASLFNNWIVKRLNKKLTVILTIEISSVFLIINSLFMLH